MPDPFSLKGKNAIVTGGSRNMGRQFALALADAGASVAMRSNRHIRIGLLERLFPRLRTPLILPQGLWLICLAIFTLVILVKLGGTLALLVRGGGIPAAAQSLDIGETDDETRAELASLDRRRAQDHT